MSNNRTLIAYATRMGATAESALEIEAILRQKYGLDVVNLKKNPSPKLREYNNVIIGSGIAMGKWVRQALQFLGNSFEGKKVAVFISSTMAGDPRSYDETFTKFIKYWQCMLTLNLLPKQPLADASDF